MNSKIIINYLDKTFPLTTGLPFDNNGKNFYYENEDVDNCLIVLDIDIAVIKYAIKKKINFIISHHPVIFIDYESDILNLNKLKLFNLIEKNKITCYTIHTTYDVSTLGMNYKILKLLNATEITLFNECDVAYKGIVNQLSLNQIIDNIKEVIPINYLEFIGDLNNKINKIVIAAGSGNFTAKSLNKKNDLYITGELKWSVSNLLWEKNINVLMLGHYMEQYFVKDLAIILKNKLNNVNIIEYKRENIINVLNLKNKNNINQEKKGVETDVISTL